MVLLKDVSIRKKLCAFPLAAGALFFGLSLLFVIFLIHEDRVLKHVERQNLAKISTLWDLFLKLSTNHADLVSLFTTTAELDEEQIYATGKRNLYLTEQLYDDTALFKTSYPFDENESRRLKILLDRLKKYKLEASSAIETASVDLALANEFMMRADRSYNNINSNFAGLLETTQANTLYLIGTARYSVVRKIESFIILGLLTMFVLVCVGMFAAFRLSRQLKTKIYLMTQLAEGDTSIEIPVDDRQDEIGDLSRGIAAFKMSLIEEARAKDLAETANTTKSDFLAKMSHELRTPLHGILSFARFGVMNASSAKPDKLRGYFEKIADSGAMLLELVNDLLDLAKLEAGKMELNIRPDDIGAAIELVADEFTSVLSDRDVGLRCELPGGQARIEFDELKIMQVLRNLLSNAVKFSPKDGVIELSAKYGDESAVICVRDHGAGVPEGELESIFNRFEQSSQTSTGAGGTGLGLSICREIVTRHQGRVWAENHPQGGAMFFVELPMHHEDGVDSAPALDYRLAAEA